MSVDYDHSLNTHSLPGPRVALPTILEDKKPQSFLDVGCGVGTWLKAAQECGITDVFGVDGIATPAERFCVPLSLFSLQDLTRAWNLGRRFDMAVCLEVAEHLDEQHAPILIDALVRHSDWIVFGAACPGQGGQHHVNCQWPAYWQKLFNERGYVCSDAVRWKIWNDDRIEVWYRQNMFVARCDAAQAGKEPRILPMIHPAHFELMTDEAFNEKLRAIESGWLPYKWYLSCLLTAFTRKILKKFS